MVAPDQKKSGRAFTSSVEVISSQPGKVELEQVMSLGAGYTKEYTSAEIQHWPELDQISIKEEETIKIPALTQCTSWSTGNRIYDQARREALRR